MLSILLLVFAAAALTPLVFRLAGRRASSVLALVPAATFLWLLAQLGAVIAGRLPTQSWPWVPDLGVALGFRLDGLGLLFALLISGIGTVVLTYAGAYFAHDPRQPRFFVVVLAFMAAMLGLVFADDLLLLFVFWELTSITSYLLVGYDHEKPEARAAALQALLVTAGGGLALLAGALLLGAVAGTFSLSALVERAPEVRAHPLYGTILLLVAVGAFTKSAQAPFHFWLPGAMAAPSPVSAYLHSATMVKAGLYLLARLAPVLGGTDAWHYGLAIPGAATMLLGAVMAVGQDDLKRVLAYTTVSALGIVTLLLGLDTTAAVKAAMVFVVVHALYKGALFLVAGGIDHEAGTRSIRRLGGLARAMPLTAAVAALSALSMAGLPPLFGFIAKELLYEAKSQAPQAALFVTACGVTANVLIVAAAGLVGVRPFFGRTRATPKDAHEGPVGLWAGPLVLALGGLAFGIVPGATIEPLIGAAVAAVRAEPTEVTLKLWHGLNPILALSVATVALGLSAFAWRDRLQDAARPLDGLSRFGPAAVYAAGLRGLVAVARAQTWMLQSGRLSAYVRVCVATFVAATAWVLVSRQVPAWPEPSWPLPHEAALLALILAGAITAVRAGSRLAAVAALGVVGVGVALSFLVWSGPDLALTQFAIETLSVLLFVFVVYRLPRLMSLSRARARVIDALIAASAGTVITLLVWAASGVRHDAPLQRYFSGASVPEGKGRNVVNVILVDFRAFDTLGEITVLVVAALGVHALVRLRPEEGR